MAASTGGTVVALSKNGSGITAPGSVTVAQGSNSSTFTVTATQVTTTQLVTMTASAGGAAKSVSLTVNAVLSEEPASLSSFTCTPTTLVGGSAQCTVVLAQAATGSGAVVTLSSSHNAVSVPPSVTIPAGASNASFDATLADNGVSGVAQLTATMGQSAKTVQLSFGSSSGLTSLSCSPSALAGGGTAVCTATLAAAAPAGGTVVSLSTDNPVLSVPASVTVPQGSKSAQFSATSQLTANDGQVTIEASADGSVKTAVIALSGLRPLSLSCSPLNVTAGAQLTCEVLLSSDHLETEISVALSSNSVDVSVPPSVTARPGQERLSFRATTNPSASHGTAILTAALGNARVSQEITVITTFAPLLKVPGPQVVIFDSTLEFDVTAEDPTRQSVSISPAGIPQGALFSLPGHFSWTPNESQLGEYTVTFTATNPLGLSATASVRITVVLDEPILGAMVNSASYSTDLTCSPGGLASIFGTGFTRQHPEWAASFPLPTKLAGVRVKINEEPAALLYASGTQVNLQCPLLPADTQLAVVIESDLGVSQPVEGMMQHATPGIFTLQATGSGQGAVIVAATGDLAMVTDPNFQSAPARQEDFIAIYGTGLGPVDSPVHPGRPAPKDRPAVLLSDIQVAIGDVFGEVHFAGLAPGFVGLYQVNAKIPSFAPVGDRVPVSLLVRFPDGRVAESNKVEIAIEAN